MLYETFNSIKEFFKQFDWYHFFDNSTVAAILAVTIGATIAVWQYKKQKRIDFIEIQKHKLIDLLVSLSAKIEHVHFILETILDTYRFCEQKLEAVKNFYSVLEKYEIPRLSKLINEEIPLIDKNIIIYFSLYFQDERRLKKLHDDYKKKLKNWHGFVVNNYTTWITSITEKKEIPSELNTKTINEAINKLVEEIKNI